MNDEESKRELEGRIRRLEERLYVVERRLGPLQQVLPPPIVAANPASPPPWVGQVLGRPQRRSMPGEGQRPEETEYQIGARVLPIVGGGVIIVAFIFLVSYAFQKGLLTPQSLFVGELALSALFIVLGLVKRNERENFGQLLVAIGSCGLYVTMAGNNVYQHLVSDEVLVGSFIGLSLANIGFSGWRSSRVFLAIGVLGGIIGALMPLHRNNFMLSGELQLLIVAAAGIVIARNRWLEFAAILFLVAGGALAPGLYGVSGPWLERVIFLYANGLVCAATAATCRTWRAYDPWEALIPLGVFAFAIMGVNVRGGAMGSLHEAGLAAAITLLSFAFGDAPVMRKRLLEAASAVLLLIAPAGLYHFAIPIYAVLTIAGTALLMRTHKLAFLCFLWAEVVCLVGSYYGVTAWAYPWQKEFGYLMLMSAALIGASLATWRHAPCRSGLRGFLAGAGIMAATIALFRAGLLLGLQIDPMHRNAMTQMVTGLLLGASAGVLAFKRRSSPLTTYSWALFSYSALNYLLLTAVTADKGMTRTEELASVGAMIGMALFLSATIQRVSQSVTAARAIAYALCGALFMRGGYVVGMPLDALHRAEIVLFYPALFMALIATALALGGQSRVDAAFAVTFSFLASMFYLNAMLGCVAGRDEELAMLTLLGVFTFLLAFVLTKDRKPTYGVRLATGTIIGLFFSRMAFLILTGPPIAISRMAAVTVAWTTYAVLLMAAGFFRRQSVYRYMSLALFGITLVKVFIYDLSSLDQGIRIAVLMALGGAMLAGGYWYIHGKGRMLPG